MPSLQVPLDTGLPAREKRAVALASVVAAALLTTMKAVVGIWTGSLGVLSEAAHSALDLLAAALTYVSVRVSDKPADSSHHFGHGKVEPLSAFVETGLLLVTCAWILVEAARRVFFHHEVHVEPSVWAFGVLFISITIDTVRSRALFRVARKYNSQALEADALHFSSDVYSTSVVVLGLVLVAIARQPRTAFLAKADPLAACVVAGIVVWMSVRLGKRTVDALVDAAPEGILPRITHAVSRVPGVVRYGPIRVRQSGNQLFVDLKLTLDSDIPFEHAQSVVALVEDKVHELYPTADVIIHAAPREPSSENLVERIRSVAHRQNFQIHDVTAYEMNGRTNVHLDLEVDPALTFEAAHDQATQLEETIKQEIQRVDEVNVHIEPMRKQVEAGGKATLKLGSFEKKLFEIARKTPGLLDCHSIDAHQVGDSVMVRMHCTVDPGLAVSRVHDLTEDLEFRIRKAFPLISKVSIHAEPRAHSERHIP